MTNDKRNFEQRIAGTWAMFLMVGLLIGGGLGVIFTNVSFMKYAVKHGHAHYNAVSGDWEWNDVK